MAYPVRVSAGLLFDSVTGAWVGVQGADGKEYLCAGVQNVGASVAPVAFNSAAVVITGGAIAGATGAFTTLAASAAVALNPANANVVLSPTGTGLVTIAPATAGTLNNMSVGATTPSTGSFTSTRATGLLSALTDGSGTPGAVTQNVMHGRAAFAAAGASVVVTNSLVAANSSVFVQLGGLDATLLMVRVTPAAGSFTVTGNASATGITPFDYLVVQN